MNERRQTISSRHIGFQVYWIALSTYLFNTYCSPHATPYESTIRILQVRADGYACMRQYASTSAVASPRRAGESLVRWLVGWLVGWFVGWLAGWLHGWLVAVGVGRGKEFQPYDSLLRRCSVLLLAAAPAAKWSAVSVRKCCAQHLRRPKCRMQKVNCKMQLPRCPMQNAECNVKSEMQNPKCPNAQCPNAQCPNAQVHIDGLWFSAGLLLAAGCEAIRGSGGASALDALAPN